jgi:hypothetical protein
MREVCARLSAQCFAVEYFLVANMKNEGGLGSHVTAEK